MSKMTEKQASYIVGLYNQVHGTSCGFISQCRELYLPQRPTSAAASAAINELKAQLGR